MGESQIEKFLEEYEIKRLHLDFLQRIVLLTVAGLGLITALAWDDAFKDLFKLFFHDFDSLDKKFLYALLLTLLTALVTVRLNKIIKKKGRVG